MKKVTLLLISAAVFGCSTTEYISTPQDLAGQKVVDDELSKGKQRTTNFLEVIDHSLMLKTGNEFEIESHYVDDEISFSFTDKATAGMVIEEMNALLDYQGVYIDNCVSEGGSSSSSSEPSENGAQAALASVIPGLPIQAKSPSTTSIPQQNQGPDYKKFIYDGKLSGLFRSLENVYDVTVEFSRGSYVVSRCKVENLHLKGTLSSMEATLETASDSAGGSNGSFSGTVDLSYDLQAALLEELNLLLSPEGVVKVNSTTSSLLVIDRPSYLRNVNKIVDNYNKVLERQILLLVTVLRYGDSDVNQLGLDWDNVLVDGSTAIISGSSFSETISGLNLGFKKEGSSTTELLLRSYFNNGHSILSTKADLLTQNGVPTPLSVAKSQSYISSVTTEYDKETEREIRQAETSVLNEGFNMMFKALAIEDKISVTTHITQNELVSLTADQGITLPTTFNRQFLQSFRVDSGDVILLAGYEENITRTNDSTAAPGTILFGGTNNRENTQSKIVILIEPRVL
ncbi:hypothetical protein L4C33_08310 [Vibrio makurazakiensis]|uniref:hypothetical protein n=1 Tax=Vibrio makurazakiensis TaxID=2910250 RepID=UPI003D0D88D1